LRRARGLVDLRGRDLDDLDRLGAALGRRLVFVAICALASTRTDEPLPTGEPAKVAHR
jgi:hypothetical protein